MIHQPILSRTESRDLDRRASEEFGMPGIALMENAGRGAADYLISLNVKNPVVICCGKGNNAGDGFVIARHLDNHSIPVKVLLFSAAEELRGDAEVNYNIIAKSKLNIIDCRHKNFENELKNAEWIVDALFGTGLVGEVKSPFDNIIKIINESNKKILAVDIPSGLDCDTGRPLGIAIKAYATVTFATLKKGFTDPEAKKYLGTVQVVDIGIPKILLAS
jgi:NAD(P)H-hydrate epimerase